MSRNIKYEPVEGENDDDSLSLHLKKSKQRSTWFWLTVLVLVSTGVGLASGSACFHWGKREGRHAERQDFEADWFSPPGLIDHEFTYRREFALRPGNESDMWWRRVFPIGRGFVQHPEISPVPTGLAVYHQLHCLLMSWAHKWRTHNHTTHG
ncbi:hypothetical protein B0T17DRAFT_512637 [Bombardia bombarda]|uniref:Uncharacterized protein n=1 Tax=Bombardia bombarda TaxID=252184 RepID=A0AA39W9K9_9PEZI|nr:hypothetical protein B0T17DRAFT_512637 [Bombardia bombarda]